MNIKELKKIGRTELLEMLLQQVEENEALRQELEEVKTRLEQRAILMEQSGSVAEAALRLNDVFDNAQRAADDYLESIRIANANPEEYVRRVQDDAQAKADQIIADAERRAERIRQDADEYWQHMRSRVQELLEEK